MKTSTHRMRMIRKPSGPTPIPLAPTVMPSSGRRQCRLPGISRIALAVRPTQTSPTTIIRMGRNNREQRLQATGTRKNSVRRRHGIMPSIKTSYSLTMLLAAFVLGTDCVGSEMDALQSQYPTPMMDEKPPLVATTTTMPFAKDLTQMTATTAYGSQHSHLAKISSNPTEVLNKQTYPTSDTKLSVHTNEKSKLLINPEESTEDEAIQTLEEPPTESEALIKGFSIPTFLPPFQLFDVVDLHAYAAGMATTAQSGEAITTTTIIGIATSDRLLQAGDIYENRPDGAPKNPHRPDQLSAMLPDNGEQLRRFPAGTVPTQNLTVQMGNHAYLPCNIAMPANKSVSWVRMSDGHILTVDDTSFITDQRIQAIYKNDDNELTWSLQIKYVQPADAGWYECQVASEPKMSSQISMQVVVPFTELIGDQSRFVKAGSKVALHCIVRGTLVPPSYIIWFHGKLQVTDDNKWGWYTEIDRSIFGNATSNQNTIGSLIIPIVRKQDTGNYTCQPSNSESVSVDLHVLSGEYSASAIMSGSPSGHYLNVSYFLLIFSPVLLLQT